MDEESPKEPVFRAHKRRKFLRQRHDSNAQDDAPLAVSGEVDVEISKHIPEYDDNEGDEVSDLTRIRKGGGPRNHGIEFSDSQIRRNAESEQAEHKALVLAKDEGLDPVLPSDRFVKPTGKVDVTEDIHMMAYVDAKMAKMRSSASVSVDAANGLVESDSLDQNEVAGTKIDAESTKANPYSKSGPKTHQQAQSRSQRVYHRPTKRRSTPGREQSDIARDSMIDQIMRESEIPIYDKSVVQPSNTDGGDTDNDSAAAEAFKAQLLEDMQQNRRRPTKAVTTASTGPKLGGSRSQRGKMRAIEEANKTGASNK